VHTDAAGNPARDDDPPPTADQPPTDDAISPRDLAMNAGAVGLFVALLIAVMQGWI